MPTVSPSPDIAADPPPPVPYFRVPPLPDPAPWTPAMRRYVAAEAARRGLPA